MPTYEYRCKHCGHHFEEFQSVTDKPLAICPKCSGELQRLITGGSGLIFKGSGFYITDYKNEAKEKKNGVSKTTASESKSESSGSSEKGGAKE